MAGADAPEVFEFVEEALDEIALFVEFPVAGMGSAAVGPRWDNRRCAGFQDRVVEVLDVVGTIGNDRAAGNALNQGRPKQNLAAMSRTGDQADEIAEAVGCRVELGS